MKQEEPSYSDILELVLMLGPHPILTIFDSDSKNNLALKYKVLTKVLNKEELTDEEMCDRRVFEGLPENVKPGYILR